MPSDERVVSTVFHAFPRTSILNYGLSVVLAFTRRIANYSGQFVYRRGVWTSARHRGIRLSSGQTEQHEYWEILVTIFSTFI